ncbi:M16 family metallopeptidase [Candidatus Omnitrophota bacterium]
MYKKTVFDNGLRVVSCAMSQRESVGLGVWVGAGGRYEDKHNKGVAHFLEHMVFKGTRRYGNRAIKESIEGIGGTLNAFTSEEHTCYFVKIPKQYVELSLRILSDMVLNPLLKTVDINKERTVIIEEIKMYKDLPQEHVHEILDSLVWPNHPLGMSIAGSIESVSGLQRSDFVGFRKKFYQPANVVVVATGNLHHGKFAKLADSIFRRESSQERVDFVPVVHAQKQPQFRCERRDIEQTHISLGMPSIHRNHPDRYCVGLMNIILGANMSSRLFHELREKRGLAYAVGSYAKVLQDTGIFGVRAGIENSKVVDSIEVILRELKRLTKENVRAQELSRAKEYLLGQLTLSLEDTLDQMAFVGEQIVSRNKISTLKQIAVRVGKVRIADIRRVARMIFRRNAMNLAVIGPVSQKNERTIKNLVGA